MSANLHGRSLIHARINQVPNGGATEIVRGETFVLIPLRSRLFSKSDFNTRLEPLASEILYGEYRSVGLEFLLEHRHEFDRQGEDKRLAVLDDAGRQAHFSL